MVTKGNTDRTKFDGAQSTGDSKIAHVQVSAPHLKPMQPETYDKLDELGITACIAGLHGPRVSLEVNLGAASGSELGGQIRRFCAYCSSFDKVDKN